MASRGRFLTSSMVIANRRLSYYAVVSPEQIGKALAIHEGHYIGVKSPPSIRKNSEHALLYMHIIVVVIPHIGDVGKCLYPTSSPPWSPVVVIQEAARDESCHNIHVMLLIP